MTKACLKIWLIVWVLFLPLVHIHPEADHAHGMPGHVHGGTYHTVLSCAPICAVHDRSYHHDVHQPHDLFSPSQTVGHAHPSSDLPHDFEYAPYGFSALNSWIDFEWGSPDLPQHGVATSPVGLLRLPNASTLNISLRYHPSFLLPQNLSARAPPALTL
ncbi:MAG: hypothetical protein GKS05_11160 [Nitrospirales bacterium]|nr:hypothetical protein [Nitrospirales bacterium]